MSARTVGPSTAALVVLVVLVVAGAPALVAGTGHVTVEDVGLSGPGVVTGGDRPSVAGWRAVNLTASVTTGTDTYELCVEVNGASGGGTDGGAETATLGCRRVAGTNTTENVSVPLEVPNTVAGDRELRVTLGPAGSTNGSGVVAEATLPVRVLAATGDVDDDGLSNRDELESGTDLDVADTDGDGLDDGPEVNVHETDPTSTDTDGDGLADGVEVNEQGSNPTSEDTDGDGLDDGVEVTTHGTDPTSTDTDGDGLDDGSEVNVHETDPASADTDGDGLDDGPEVNVHETDPTSTDTDGDGLDDGSEVERGTNPTSEDTDGDGLDDGPEVERYGTDPTRADTDGDGRSDGAEVANGSDPVAGEGTGPGGVPDVGPAVVAVVVVAVSLALLYRASRRGDWTLPWTGRDGGRPGTDAADDHDHDHDHDHGEPTDPVAALTDEERVQRIVDGHGGRVRQSAIVEETGWSKSKVSRVLSRMADEGRIEKITLGRENLIANPGERPDGTTREFGDDE